MEMKDSYRLFFAIPFDCDTRCIYKHVVKRLKAEFKAWKLVCVMGNEQIGTATKYDTIETFKMQNSELFRHFVKQIRNANIVIADLTDNNPNVHVELGIALSYNKNILRVTRHSYEKLGFDVRGYEVSQYKMRGDLYNIIRKYLKVFFEIKDLNFVKQNSDLYHYDPQKRELRCWKDGKEKKNGKKNFDSYRTNYQMRDGKVRITFNIVDYRGEDEADKGWFGVFLRVGAIGPFVGSCVVYIRGDGSLEIATFPERKLVGPKRLRNKRRLNDEALTLTIQLEGNLVRASIENIDLEYNRLDIQSRGSVMFGCWNSNANFWNTQIVCRDTIKAFDIFE